MLAISTSEDEVLSYCNLLFLACDDALSELGVQSSEFQDVHDRAM